MPSPKVDVSNVSIADGTIDAGAVEFKEVDYFRFRKTVDTSEKLQRRFSGLGPTFRSNDRTIFVVNAESIGRFLSNFGLSFSMNPAESPWELARSQDVNEPE